MCKMIPERRNFRDFAFASLLVFSLCPRVGRADCEPYGRFGHQCKDKDHSCVLTFEICDGKKDCPDGSDELWYDNMTSSEKEKGFRCPSGCYLPESFMCDQYNHCKEDECDCSFSNSIRCASDGACIDENMFCDGYNKACNDNEDEMRYTEAMKGEGEFMKCFAGKLQYACALPAKYHKCDGIKDCIHGGDECFCNDGLTRTILDRECFRCLDGHGEMVRSHLCNGFFDCADLSDECLCENPPSTCRQLIHQNDCGFQCKLPIGVERNFTRCINRSQVCDRTRDCYYGEDEKYCFPVSVWKERISELYADAKLPELWCCNAGYQANCLDESTYSNGSYTGCDQFYECPTDEFVEYFKYAIKCDGVPMCRSSEEECENCSVAGSLRGICSEETSELSCREANNTIFIERDAFCNGVADCNKDDPTTSSDEQNCKNRFHCTSTREKTTLISIKKSQVCDCIPDCDDASDEENCSNFTRFCCREGKQAVEYGKLCNGVDDCFDRSDECQSCIQSPFADDQHLISNKVLSAFVWIIGIVSFFGNGFVIVRTSIKLHPKNRISTLLQISLYHILALGFADLCVGVYLISLGIANVALSGKYCYEDSGWRSGNTCNFLGVLSMFGMQASVFTLTAMTVSRVFIVCCPFKSAKLWKHSIPVVFLLFVALVLAIVPILPSAQDYFTSHVKLTRNPFLGKQLTRSGFSQFANNLIQYGKEEHDFRNILGEKREIYSWTSLFQLMKHLNESFEPQYEFGYYSTHGVCLPKFFPTTSDSAWQYSIFLITINFFSFFVIAASYVVMYRISVSRRMKAKKVEEKEVAYFRRKITRIIATDFCCWMPICLIAFVKIGSKV